MKKHRIQINVRDEDDFYRASAVHALLGRVLLRLEDVVKFCETGDYKPLHRKVEDTEQLVSDIKKVLGDPER